MSVNDGTPPTIVVFDTDCVLCSSWVQFICRHERDETMRFVSAWSAEGAILAARHGLRSEDLDETYLVIDGGRGLVRSDAGLAVIRQLAMPWRALLFLSIIPRPLRDLVYGFVARNRYRWFGHRPNCFVPPAGQSHRFVSGARSATRSPRHGQPSGGSE